MLQMHPHYASLLKSCEMPRGARGKAVPLFIIWLLSKTSSKQELEKTFKNTRGTVTQEGRLMKSFIVENQFWEYL